MHNDLKAFNDLLRVDAISFAQSATLAVNSNIWYTIYYKVTQYHDILSEAMKYVSSNHELVHIWRMIWALAES